MEQSLEKNDNQTGGIIKLSRLAFDKGIEGMEYVNVSGNPTKIEIDVKYVMENHKVYVEEIAEKIGMTSDELNELFGSLDRDVKNGMYRISIPMVRLQKKCYCARVYPEIKHFTKGVLMFNGSYGQFPIDSLKEEHHKKAERFYKLFMELLDRVAWDNEEYMYNCPKHNESMEPKGLCKVCIKCEKNYGGAN